MSARKKATPKPKSGATRYQQPGKKPVPPLVWLCMGFLLGFFVSTLFNLEPGKDNIKRAAEAEPAKKPATTQPGRTQQPKVETPKFEFYTILPESEVIVQPEEVPQKSQPEPSATEIAAAKKADAARAQAILEGKTPPPAPARLEVTNFYLQAGSFPSLETARGVRAQLLLTGQEVEIETGKVSNKTWHRVLVGPFKNREQLEAAKKQLSNNGFKNLLVQQRKTRI